MPQDDSVAIYQEQVKPLLKQRCFACHGALKQEGGLRLDTVVGLKAGGDSGSTIDLDAPGNSYLLERVTATDHDYRMPPLHEGEPLTEEQAQQIRDWIASGAIGPENESPEADPDQHWAFQPIVRPQLPPPVRDSGSLHPIDRLLDVQRAERSLQARPKSDSLIQLRRLYLDLIGVPPTIEQIRKWEQEPTQQEYHRTVDQLLNDPRHGQRWARHWMDIWRYSDWWGLDQQHRNSQKHIWRWRDWIVESLNHDLGYDEMVRQMIAADEWYPEDSAKLRATGYLARNWFLFNRTQWLDETVEHVGKGFLGLTLNCAKCHDHKYDPISQEDYYQFQAIFQPYHVRLDMVDGVLDFDKDGLPRVFDAELNQPTYRLERGDESQPDQSRPMLPAAPDFLKFGRLEIQPVDLPNSAWDPGRRKVVLLNYLKQARQKVLATDLQLHASAEQVTGASQVLEKMRQLDDQQTNGPDPEPVIAEAFRPFASDNWITVGGDWRTDSDGMVQHKDGPVRSRLRSHQTIPQDFDATVRFQILGGSRWRSVGISVDATSATDAIDPTNEDSEIQFYVSAVENGSKLQAAFLQQGQWHYPGETGVQTLAVPLNHTFTLRVQARGTLFNVSLDGKPILAWRSPMPRTEGAFQLTTFDAIARFQEVSVHRLGESVELRGPEGEPPQPPRTLAGAQLALEQAQLAYRIAQAERDYREKEQATLETLLQWLHEDQPDDADQTHLRRIAVRNGQERDLAKAVRDCLLVEQKRQQSITPTDESLQQEAERAKLQQQACQIALETPVDEDAPLPTPIGAKWVATRFQDSGKDDPELGFPRKSSGRRQALARWITDPQNPLTARVAVNHLWTRHMGQPLVPTVFDFGRNGTPPANPELLDWLASELIENDFSMKHLHRLIVTSDAYRMSSSRKGANREMKMDPDNESWWRRPTSRMESQLVRDSLLAFAGILDVQSGGPPVAAERQAESRRRSLYFFHSNNQRNRFLTTFDEALVKDCYRRQQSIVPQQALALINSRLVAELAPQIAARLKQETDSDEAFVRLAFQWLLASEPSQDELRTTLSALDDFRRLSEATEDSPYQSIVWALINHNDFVTIR